MNGLKIAAVAACLAMVASPCLAFSFGSAPVDSSGRSMLVDPDARLEATTSAMQDAYVQNNGGGGTSGAALLQNTPNDAYGPAYNFGGANGVAIINSERTVTSAPTAPASTNGARH